MAIDEKRNRTNDPAANPDPITKAPGAHPVGTGVGAALGGAAVGGGAAAIAAGAAAGSVAGPIGTIAGRMSAVRSSRWVGRQRCGRPAMSIRPSSMTTGERMLENLPLCTQRHQLRRIWPCIPIWLGIPREIRRQGILAGRARPQPRLGPRPGPVEPRLVRRQARSPRCLGSHQLQ